MIPTLEVGGAERQLSLLASEQVRKGYQVHVAVRRNGYYGSMLSKVGAVVHEFGDYRGIDFRLFISTYQLLRRLKPKLIQTWLPQMDLIGGVVALVRQVPWIATERASCKAYENDGAYLRNVMRKIVVRWSSALVTNSIGGESYWRVARYADNKIFIIRNAIDHESIKAEINFVNHICESDPVILIVGRLISSKAIDIILTALSLIPKNVSFNVKVIGDGPIRESINYTIRQLGLENRVDLVGSINWWSQMASAAILISMSRFEGQPNVVLEAMAGNCPLIVSNIPAHREILDDETAVFVPIDDPAELAIAIQAVLSNPMMARMRAAKARTRTEAMTIENIANSYDLIYKFALEGKK